MRSKNAEFLKEGLIEQARKLTPAQRLDKFVEHSKRMRSLRKLAERDLENPAFPNRPDDR